MTFGVRAATSFERPPLPVHEHPKEISPRSIRWALAGPNHRRTRSYEGDVHRLQTGLLLASATSTEPTGATSRATSHTAGRAEGGRGGWAPRERRPRAAALVDIAPGPGPSRGRPRSPARGRRRHRATLCADRARPAVVLALPLVHACRHCVHVDHTDGRTAAMVGNAMRPDRSHFGRCQNSFEVLSRIKIGIST